MIPQPLRIESQTPPCSPRRLVRRTPAPDQRLYPDYPNNLHPFTDTQRTEPAVDITRRVRVEGLLREGRTRLRRAEGPRRLWDERLLQALHRVKHPGFTRDGQRRLGRGELVAVDLAVAKRVAGGATVIARLEAVGVECALSARGV